MRKYVEEASSKWDEYQTISKRSTSNYSADSAEPATHFKGRCFHYTADGYHLFFWNICLGLSKGVIYCEKSIYVNMWTRALGFSITNKLTTVSVNSEDYYYYFLKENPTSGFSQTYSNLGVRSKALWHSLLHLFILTRNLWDIIVRIRENWSLVRIIRCRVQTQIVVFRFFTKDLGVQIFPFEGW